MKSNKSIISKTPRLDGTSHIGARVYQSAYQSPSDGNNNLTNSDDDEPQPVLSLHHNQQHHPLQHLGGRSKSNSVISNLSNFQLPSPAIDDYKFNNNSSRNVAKHVDKDFTVPPKSSPQLPLHNTASGSKKSKQSTSSTSSPPVQNERTPLLEPNLPSIKEANANQMADDISKTTISAPLPPLSRSAAETPPRDLNNLPALNRQKSLTDTLQDGASNVINRLKRHSSIISRDNLQYFTSRRQGLFFNTNDTNSIQLQNSYETETQEFLLWLDSELLKIDNFFKAKEDQSVKRYLLLQDQLYQLKENRAKEKAKQTKLAFHIFPSNRAMEETHIGENGGSSENNNNNNSEPQPNTNSVPDPCNQLGKKLSLKHNKTVAKIYKYELPTFPRFKFLKKNSNSSSSDEDDDDYEEEDEDDLKDNNSKNSPPSEANNNNNLEISDPRYNRRDYRKKTKLKKSIPPYNQAKRQLKHATLEFYRSLELLKGYRTMNRTACRKMIKKFDKTTDSNKLPEFMNKVNNSYFATSEVLDDLIVKVENLFSFYIENGNRKLAIEKLRSKSKIEEHYGSLFMGGFFIGVAIPMIIFTAVKGAQHKHSHPEFNYLFQIWGGFFIAILMGLAFTVHFLVWDHYKINYKFIFDFNVRTALDYRQYIFIPSLLLLAGSIISYFSFSDELQWLKHFESRDMPWIFVGLTLLIFLNPFHVLYYKSRRWLLIAIWRLVLSGFYPVEFKDFFLGDIFCSLTYTMSNISFIICVYASNWNQPKHCGSGRSKTMGFLSCLPSIWRLLQCFRRFADTGEWFPHLANMGKYAVSILYYMTLSIYRIDKGDTHKKAVFILFAILNSLYSGLWDIFMDWSLMQFGAKNKFLRNNLGYKNKNHFYYFAMVSDIVLRFQWVFYVFFTRRMQASTLTSFGVALAEFIRRFIWVFFRLENEHCTNVNLLKAAREITLPYPIIEKIHSLPLPSSDSDGVTNTIDKGANINANINANAKRRDTGASTAGAAAATSAAVRAPGAHTVHKLEDAVNDHRFTESPRAPNGRHAHPYLTGDDEFRPGLVPKDQQQHPQTIPLRAEGAPRDGKADDATTVSNDNNNNSNIDLEATPRARAQSFFQNISRAVTLAHAKDFQRSQRKAPTEEDNSSDEEDEEDEDEDEDEDEADDNKYESSGQHEFHRHNGRHGHHDERKDGTRASVPSEQNLT